MKRLSVFVVIAFAVLTACRTSKQGYVAKGNKLFAAGKYAEADIEYRNAIKKDAQYGEAYYRLGLTELKLQNGTEAQRTLLRAVQLQPDNLDAKEKLGSLMLEYYMLDPRHSQSYYNVVKQMSDEILKKDPNSVEGLKERAMLAAADRKPNEAITLLRKTLQIRPNDAVLTMALARQLSVNGQNQEAESLLVGITSRDKTYGAAYDLLYQMYSATNRAAEADNIIRAKANNNPKQADYILELAGHYARNKKEPEMKAVLQRLIDDPKDFPSGRVSVGDFYMKIRNYPEAVRYYEEGLRSSTRPEDKTNYQKRAVNALVAEGKTAEASSLVDQILKENPKDDEALRVHANLLLASGKQDSVQTARTELEDLSKRTPSDASVWLGLARSEVAKGDLNAARAEYLEAIRKRPNYLTARYAVAEIGLLNRHPEETLTQAGEILKLRPNDTRARLLRAQALVRTGNNAQAQSELTSLSKEFPKDNQVQVELGLLALSQKKYSEANEIFTKLRATGDERATAGLAETYSARKEFDKAIPLLNEGLKKSPDSVLLTRELAATAAAAGHYDVAITEFHKIVTLHPRSVDDLLGLGDVYGLKGDLNSAITAYQQALGVSSTNLNAGLGLSRALASAGRTNEAKAQYESVLKAHPDDPMVLNDFAYFLVDNGGDTDQALRLAQRAVEKSPDQPGYSDTIACIYLKKGQKGSALQIFSNLVRKYPDFATFRYHFGMALLENGDKGRARKELQTALASHPSSKDEVKIKELLGKIG